MNGDLLDLAAKVVSLRADGDLLAQDLLAVEARNLLLLNLDHGHENVVRMLGGFVVAGDACIILELATSDLHAYMRSFSGGRVPEREAYQHAMELAAAVAFMHERGIAHRDIKLANVLLKSCDQATWIAVLADFGLSVDVTTLEQSSGRSNTECGTKVTMAPEVHGGDWYNPRRSDVWSLGMTILALVAPNMFGYYAWSIANEKDAEYRRFKELRGHFAKLRSLMLINARLISWPAEVPQPTAIWGLLQSDEYDMLAKELPPVLLMVLDGMLRPEPDERFTAADVHAHLMMMLE